MNNPTDNLRTLKELTAGFNSHDLDSIMDFFAEDCELDMPRGPDPWGLRYQGKVAVREGLATRFQTVPDVHYSEDRHFATVKLSVKTLTGKLSNDHGA